VQRKVDAAQACAKKIAALGQHVSSGDVMTQSDGCADYGIQFQFSGSRKAGNKSQVLVVASMTRAFWIRRRLLPHTADDFTYGGGCF
jgi:hypothetical protein